LLDRAVDARVTPGHANGKYDTITSTPFLRIGSASVLWRRVSFPQSAPAPARVQRDTAAATAARSPRPRGDSEDACLLASGGVASPAWFGSSPPGRVFARDDECAPEHVRWRLRHRPPPEPPPAVGRHQETPEPMVPNFSRTVITLQLPAACARALCRAHVWQGAVLDFPVANRKDAMIPITCRRRTSPRALDSFGWSGGFDELARETAWP
jgi:hypothetical protein